MAGHDNVAFEVVAASQTLRRNPGLTADRAVRAVRLDGCNEARSQSRGDPLMRDGGRRHRDDNAVDQLVVPVVIRAGIRNSSTVSSL